LSSPAQIEQEVSDQIRLFNMTGGQEIEFTFKSAREWAGCYRIGVTYENVPYVRQDAYVRAEQALREFLTKNIPATVGLPVEVVFSPRDSEGVVDDP
jgi:hypothetical protein